MEGERNTQLDAYSRLPMITDGFASQPLSESLLRSTSFQPSAQDQSMIGLPMFSSFQGEPFRDFIPDKSVTSDGSINRDAVFGGSNLNVNEHCLGSTWRNLNNDTNSSLLSVPSESLRAMLSSDCSYATSSSVPTSLNCGYDGLVDEMNGKWDHSRFPTHPEFNWRAPTSGWETMQYDENEWILQNSASMCLNHPYETSISYNELSLSLATRGRPSIPEQASVEDHCRDMSCSRVTNDSESHARLGLHGDKDLSCGFPSEFSQMISGSRYLAALQQMLSEISSYSLESVDRGWASYSAGLVSSSSELPVSSNHFADRQTSFNGSDDICGDDDGSFEAPAETSHRRGDVESKKSQLLALLQVVDERYNRCLDEIHTVISAFHAATELNPQLHACFALQRITFFYKNLRERISNEILAMGMDNRSARDNGRSFEKSFIQKQWALQQLKRKDQLLWRPQRGLPERSVSVLRAWMFDNFLHPYPKDAEKHLLAIKSGLTRSQVSNWFINARVRLWKPLVEEMCAELNRRKSHQTDEGINNSKTHRSRLSIYDYNPRLDA